MRNYYVEVYGGEYPDTTRHYRIHRTHPNYADLSNNLYCLWHVYASSKDDAFSRILSGSGGILIGHDWTTGEDKLLAAVAEAKRLAYQS